MDSEQEPGGTASDAARAQLALRPLTKQHPNGDPYTRRTPIVRQLRAVLPLPPREHVRRARIRGEANPHYLADETLVYLIRHHWERGDERTGDWLFRRLVERCAGIVAKYLTRRLPEKDAKDAGQDLLLRLHSGVADLGPQGDYLEISFGHWLKRRAIDVGDHLNRKLKRERQQDHVPLEHIAGHQPTTTPGMTPTFAPVEPWDELAPSPAALLDRQTDEALKADEEHRLRRAVDALPDRLRVAVILHFWKGMKINSTDPDEPTLTRYFNKAERTIRYWLTQAKADLKRRLENEP